MTLRRHIAAIPLAATLLLGVPSQALSDPLSLIDTHIHYSHDAWERYPPEVAVKILRDAGLKRAFVSSSSDDGTQMLYSEAPDLIVPVLRPYKRRGELGSWMHEPGRIKMIRNRLAKYHYAGIGEFHAFGSDVKTKLMRDIISEAEKHDLFLHAHSDAEAVRLIFEQSPSARVLWAHSGFDDPAVIRQMLRQYPTLWADLAHRSDHARNGHVLPEWKALFEDFPDRFMIGTDTYTPERWPFVIDHATWSRDWLTRLPPDLAKKIAWENAETLIKGFK